MNTTKTEYDSNYNTRWRNYLRLFKAALPICYIPTAFTYGFNLLPARLQEASFYSVKGHLSKGKKPCFEGWNDTF